jgi:hypothetical protein
MRRRDLDLKSQEPDKLLIEIRTSIEEARRQTAVAVSSVVFSQKRRLALHEGYEFVRFAEWPKGLKGARMIRNVEMGRFYSDLPEAIRRGRFSHQDIDWSPEHGRAPASNAASDNRRRTRGRDTPVLGESGLMQFVEFDHGMIVRKGTELHTSRIIRLVI